VQCCILLSFSALFWATLHPTELSVTLLSFPATSARLYPTELRCTLLSYPPLLSYAASFSAMLHPSELEMYLLSFAAPYCAMLHPTELQCTLLSYSILWATLHRTELSVTLLSFPATPELGCILLSYAAACTLRSKDAPYWSAERHCTFWATLYPFWAKLTISVIDENLGQGVIAGVNNSSNRLLPVTTTLVIIYRQSRLYHWTIYCRCPWIFVKIWNSPNWILRGLVKTDSRKKSEVENFLCHTPFKLLSSFKGQ